jgi:hypothetical protein
MADGDGGRAGRDGDRAEGAAHTSDVISTDDDRLVCVACAADVTRASERIVIGGATEHTFVNPGGYVYVIGTFGRASVVSHGEPSTEWSWFPGHAWCIAGCTRCHVHLGWSFRGDAAPFYGLILDRLRSAA